MHLAPRPFLTPCESISLMPVTNTFQRRGIVEGFFGFP